MATSKKVSLQKEVDILTRRLGEEIAARKDVENQLRLLERRLAGQRVVGSVVAKEKKNETADWYQCELRAVSGRYRRLLDTLRMQISAAQGLQIGGKLGDAMLSLELAKKAIDRVTE